MSEFLIKSDILASKERELDAIAKKLKRYSNDIDRKRSSLDYKTKSANRLNSTLSTIANNVETCGNKSAVMSDKLSQAVKVYTNTERTIAGVKTQSTKSEKGKSGETKDTGNWALDALSDFLKKAGLIGGSYAMFEGIVEFISNIKSGKDILTILDSAVGVAKPATKTISSFFKKVKKMKYTKKKLRSDLWLESFFGFGDYFKGDVGKASVDKCFSKRLSKNFNKAWKNEIGDGLAVSAIFSGIANIIENTKDAYDGKMSWGRAIQEMVGETAVDVAVGAAITAGVAAVAGATVGAPAILVGGATVLITMGLDGLTKHFTNGEKQDFSELVSDAFLDTCKAVGQVKQAVVTKATKLVTDACSKTIGAAGKFLGNVAKGFGITSKLKLA